MRKTATIAAVALCAAIIFALVGCGGGGPSSSSNTSAPSTASSISSEATSPLEAQSSSLSSTSEKAAPGPSTGVQEETGQETPGPAATSPEESASPAGEQEPPDSPEAEQPEPASPAGTDKPGTTNPWKTYTKLAQAIKAAGFDFTTPLDALPGDRFRVIPGDTIEVIHEDDALIVMRKSIGDEDVSGDWNEYGFVIDKDGITLKGSSVDKISLAIWSRNGFSYSISAGCPVSLEKMLAWAKATR